MKIAIVNDDVPVKEILKFDKIIAIENGMKMLLDKEIIPDYFICDFDTYNYDHDFDPEIKIIKLNPKKDHSDTEEAIKFAREKYPKSELVCFQFLGPRTSFIIQQMLLVIKYNLKFVYENSTMMPLNKENKFQKRNYKYFSIICLTANEITITNSNYNYSGEINFTNSTKFISNEFVNERVDVQISFAKTPKCVIIFDQDI